MNLMKNGTKNVKIKKIKKFLSKAFYLINGKINYVYPARKIVFSEKPSVNFMNKDKNPNVILGQNTLDYVIFNPYEMKEWIEINYEVSELQFKGLLLGILTHELSHMDQRFRTTYDKSDMCYPIKGSLESEIANDKNTLRFIEKNYDIISSELGIFDMSTYVDVSVYNIKKANEAGIVVDGSLIRYEKINNVRDRLIEALSSILNLDIYRMIESGYLNDIKYLRLSVSSTKKFNASVIIPVEVLYKPLDEYTNEDIKKINAFIADELLGGYKADVGIEMDKMDTGDKILIFNICRYSKSYVAMKSLTVYSLNDLYVYKDDEYSNELIKMIKIFS